MTRKKTKARQIQQAKQMGFNPEKAGALKKKVRWIVLLCGGIAAFSIANTVVEEQYEGQWWQALRGLEIWVGLAVIAVVFVLLYFGLRWAIGFLGTRFGGM